jgi:hypothetical protein
MQNLLPKYLPNREILTCPMLKNDSSVGYEYFPGKDTDPGTKVLLISKGKSFDNKPIVISYNGQAVIEPGK